MMTNEPFSDFLPLFDEWLSRNRHRFKYPPVSEEREERFLRLRFAGIRPEISVIAHNIDITISIGYQGDNWDGILVCDFVFEKQNEEGLYYCEQCPSEKRTLYASRQELWEEHTFEPFLKEVNTRFDPSQWVL